ELELGDALVEVRLRQRRVDDAGRTAEAEEHRVGPAADLDAIDVVGVHRSRADEEVARNVGPGETAYARARQRAGEGLVVVDLLTVRVVDHARVGEIARGAPDLRAQGVDEQA